MSRTPRNYNGIFFPVKKLDTLLGDFLGSIEPKKTVQKDEVFKAWCDTIGERFQGQTKPLSFELGTLTILVSNQMLYSLLCTHEKKRLLAELQKKIPQIRVKNLHFRIG